MQSPSQQPADVCPHGSWPSPVDARATLAGFTRRASPRTDGADVYWTEARPEDRGRVTVVRRREGRAWDVTPPDHNVRTAYLEYGGGEYAVAGGTLVWVDYTTQRVWRRVDDGEPEPMTPEAGKALRWSCFRIDLARRAVFCLCEDQRDIELEPVNSLVRLDLDGENADLGSVLVAGRERRRSARSEEHTDAELDEPGPDFVSDPALSPDGSRLGWLTWNHPQMAWQATTLWLGELDDAGDLSGAAPVTGPAGQALEQPLWLDDATLLVIGDASGWGNLYRLEDHALQPVTTGELDFGEPRWVPDLRSYAVLDGRRVIAARSREGFRELVTVDVQTGETTPVDTSTTFVRDIAVVDGNHVVVDASFATSRADVVEISLNDGSLHPVAEARAPGVPEGFAASPEPVSWPTPDGAMAHGFLYRPTHPGVTAPDGDLPPLVVTLHGGPTAATVPGLSAARTFWTSRGFAVLDVNYGGSTGYGRAYRERLDGRWGEVDVQDAASGARHLADQGIVDGARLAITGGSAGGFTTLAAATFTDVFGAGASHFGISDLSTLATDTHKLESRYLDGLVAPWPSGREVYEARSPINHVEQLATPLILLQGTDDKVVPPDQAEKMAQALRDKGLPVALIVFEGEGHGFRALDNQVRALESELSFYAQVFGIDLAGAIPPVQVENLP